MLIILNKKLQIKVFPDETFFLGLKSANASIIAKTEELEKAMQKHQRLMNNTFPQEWSEDIDTSLIQVF